MGLDKLYKDKYPKLSDEVVSLFKVEVSRMHITEVDTKEGKWYINHNSDWSGTAYIRGQHMNPEEPGIAIPGAILLAIGMSAAQKMITDKLINVLQDL